jgi:hypothetical protein
LVSRKLTNAKGKNANAAYELRGAYCLPDNIASNLRQPLQLSSRYLDISYSSGFAACFAARFAPARRN